MVEPLPFNLPSFSFTDCESSTTSSITTSFRKTIGVNDPIFDYNNTIWEKLGVTNLASPIKASTSVSFVKRFSQRISSNSIHSHNMLFLLISTIHFQITHPVALSSYQLFAFLSFTFTPVSKPPQPRIVFSKVLHLVCLIILLPSLTSSADLYVSL